MCVYVFMCYFTLFFSFSFFLFHSSSMCTGLIVVLPWESGKVSGVFVTCPLKSVASAQFPQALSDSQI